MDFVEAAFRAASNNASSTPTRRKTPLLFHRPHRPLRHLTVLADSSTKPAKIPRSAARLRRLSSSNRNRIYLHSKSYVRRQAFLYDRSDVIAVLYIRFEHSFQGPLQTKAKISYKGVEPVEKVASHRTKFQISTELGLSIKGVEAIDLT